MLLEELLNVEDVSIYCIRNDTDKKIYITYTLKTIPSIMNCFFKIKEGTYNNRNMNEDKDKLKFCIIETYKSKHRLYLKWRVQELYREFISNGYTPYNVVKPLRWSLYIRVGLVDADARSTDYKAIVKLKTSMNVIYTVRSFNKMATAKKFIQDNTISNIVRLL